MNSSRIWLGRHNEEFAKSLPMGSIVLDAGAGNQPYRHLFGHCIYEAADFEMVDKGICEVHLCMRPFKYSCSGSQIRCHCAQSGPGASVGPGRRASRNAQGPQKRRDDDLLCTLFYEEHEQPYDFFRYTQFAWRHLLGNAGFEIISLDWMEGYLGTVAYQMETASKHLPRGAKNIAPGALGVAAVPLLASVQNRMQASGQDILSS